MIVLPALDMVVVTTGGNEYNGKHMAAAEGIVRYLHLALDLDGG